MKNIQTISATQARNDFFNLLRKSYLNNKTYLIEKGRIPMAYIIPVHLPKLNEELNTKQNQQLKLLEKINELRNSMKQTSNSVGLLRKMRAYGK